MLASILASGLAAGAIYALVGVTYNTMFSTSRVMSFHRRPALRCWAGCSARCSH